MKSMPGSARATPLHEHVKFVPSNRNWFSLVPEPATDIVVAVVMPLVGDVGETRGAPLSKSAKLVRLVGVARRSSNAKLVLKPPSPTSLRKPDASTEI